MGCKKKKYKTSVEAMLAIQRIQAQRDIDNLEKYERCWYACADHYHITSWTTEEG